MHCDQRAFYQGALRPRHEELPDEPAARRAVGDRVYRYQQHDIEFAVTSHQSCEVSHLSWGVASVVSASPKSNAAIDSAPMVGAFGPEDVWYNALHGDVDEVERALAGGAPSGSVDHIGVRGWTPLFAASARGHSAVVKALTL